MRSLQLRNAQIVSGGIIRLMIYSGKLAGLNFELIIRSISRIDFMCFFKWDLRKVLGGIKEVAKENGIIHHDHGSWNIT